MPSPVVPWVQNQPLTAKSLNLANYTSDGTTDNTTGIAFHAWRPVLFEARNATLTVPSSASGLRTTLATSGATTCCWVVFDSAGYFGQSQDLPAFGYYQFRPAVLGSTGDGKTAGGWYLVAHFAPLGTTATQKAAGADLLQNGTLLSVGTRQAVTSVNHGTPFYLDLVNCGTNVFAPAVWVTDSSSVNAALAANTADASGETPRFFAVWAGISASSTGSATFSPAGTYSWTAPVGVSSVTPSGTGGGAGGGAGNSAASTFGGGAGGGAEFGQGAIGVTGDGQHNYVVTVGAGGLGGTQPGANGSNGSPSTFTGDTQSITMHGGSFGTGATTTANGTGGAGGTGSTAPVHFSGGAGASGATGKYGGGGGSSAGPAVAGNSAVTSAGAPAPPGGGPGGAGGTSAIAVVQTVSGSSPSNSLTVTFPAAVSAGNTVIAFTIYQGTSPSSDPTLNLSGAGQMTSQASADLPTLSIPLQVGLYDIYNVAGGQQSITVTGHGKNNAGLICQAIEVSGLGPSPSIDASNTFAQGGGHSDVTSYSVSVATTKAPELWVGTAGAQQLSSLTVGAPAKSQGWTTFPQGSVSHSGAYSRLLSGYQAVTATGTAKYSGSINPHASAGAIVAAYTSDAPTTGQPPTIGPGGGGGGGFGQNAGADGADGSVTLTWQAASNSNYGTPALPAPLGSWPEGTVATAALLNGNTGVRDVVNFLSNPPVFRSHVAAAQSVPNATATVVTLGTLADTDTYSGWNAATSTYTIARAGIYLAGALVPYQANATGIRLAGVSVNGTTYWGPPSNGTASDQVHCSKTQMFSLNAGDTVQLVTYQTSGGSLGTSASTASRLFLVWLCAPGVPSPLPSPPDVGFRWQSGTPGTQLPALMTQHLSNDLTFLVQRPYLLAYQATAQSGLTQNVFSTAVLDTVGGIVHADTGDNYTGWSPGASNAYAAQVPGWYLVAGEMFATSSSNAGASVIAGIAASASGGQSPSVATDWYQHQAATANATAGGGATIFGMYYLLAGESLTPQVQGQTYGATYGTVAGSAFGGKINSQFGIIWIGE